MEKEAVLFTCDRCGKTDYSTEREGDVFKLPEGWATAYFGILHLCPDCTKKLEADIERIRRGE